MNASARITVTTGPDRGRLLEIIDESVSIGASPESSLVLNDPLLAERQLSITRRGARHAIFVTGTDEIEVDGTRIPPDRWVWLPQTASIHVTRRTMLEFTSLTTLSEADYEAPAPPVEPIRPRPGTIKPVAETETVTSSPAAKRGGNGKSDTKTNIKTKPKVARFITDQAGDPLVKLGSDGHLPDLALQDGTAVVHEKKTDDKSSSNLTLIAVFVLSVGLSMVMLFVPMESASSSAQQVAVARKVIRIFHGTESAPLEPYQSLLRDANRANGKRDYQTERAKLREVLKLLRAENKNSITGLTRLPPEVSHRINELTNDELKALDGPTGQFRDLKNDEQLERLLAILLRGE